MTDSMDADSVPYADLMPDLDLPQELADSAPVDSDETLLDQLDRRQNSVLQELDALDARIQALVLNCQNHRSDAA